MSLRERAAQLVWGRLGSNMTPPVSAADDEERVAEMLSDCPLGGLIVFKTDSHSIRSTLARLQELPAVPLLIGADIERGVGQQVEGCTIFPHAQAFDALGAGAEQAVAEFADFTAREARAVGLHIAFAPVADVDLYDRNPIISTRAFSKQPERAADLVRAYVRAAEEEGLVTTAKHFPGHGRTRTDSHDELPMVDASLEELHQTDLLPFRAAVEAGVSCIMTAHVAFPALDGQLRPASRSRTILVDLLRDDIGFEGLVISDSLLMAGAHSEEQSPGVQAAMLIRAGVDVLLDPDDPVALVDGLCDAVTSGIISEAEIDASVARVCAVKRKAGLFSGSPPSVRLIDAEMHGRIARAVARKAIRAGSPASGRAPDAILYVPTQSANHPNAGPMRRALTDRDEDVPILIAPWDRDSPVHLAEALGAAGRLLVVIAGGPAAWRASFLADHQRSIVRGVLTSHDCMVAALGPPSLLEEVSHVTPTLCAYSDVAVSQEALIDQVFGTVRHP